MSENAKYAIIGVAGLAAYYYRGQIAAALGLGTSHGPAAIAPPAAAQATAPAPPPPPPAPTFTIPTAAELTAAAASAGNSPATIAQMNAWEWNWYFSKVSFFPPGTDFAGMAAYAGWDEAKLEARPMTAATFTSALQNYLTSKGLARGLAGIAIAHLASRQQQEWK